MNSTRIAVDVAKSVFQVATSTVPGRVDQHHRLTRKRFRKFIADCPRSEVLMEACGSAHHWGREIQGLGHPVRLLPPAVVARYRDGNKTDRADAIAIFEAGRNEAIDAVPVKTIEQQELPELTQDPSHGVDPSRSLCHVGRAQSMQRRERWLTQRGGRQLP